ncbi:MAG: T9SS type A sorting domain-containing protein [Bacteroidetes bacterium]|nr:T9SS type A sorting domain-containing protein [Bacteroidota bacterium]
MKLKTTMLAGALLLAQLSYGQTTDPSPYCVAGYDDLPEPWSHYISNVTLGSLNNSTGDTAYAAPHYVYYNNITAPDLRAGSTYTLSVSHDLTFHFIAVFIDYNHNNSFSDSGERVLQQKYSSITSPASTASITIPATATPGTTRMRAMVFESDNYIGATNAEPCTADTLEWGETEDYNVNIVPATGVNEISKNNADLFYPNPANGVVYADQSFVGKEMTIYNVEGKVMRHGVIGNKKIDVSDMAPGQYVIKVINDSGVYTQRMSIVR